MSKSERDDRQYNYLVDGVVIVLVIVFVVGLMYMANN